MVKRRGEKGGLVGTAGLLELPLFNQATNLTVEGFSLQTVSSLLQIHSSNPKLKQGGLKMVSAGLVTAFPRTRAAKLTPKSPIPFFPKPLLVSGKHFLSINSF